MKNVGLDPGAVKRIVVGHGHWDHAGQLDLFPDAVLYIQKEELRQIDFFTSYPTEFNGGHIRAVNTVNPLTGAQVGPPQQACARSPVCGYPPQTLAEIESKVLGKKAKIVDGPFVVAPGLMIHPAFRGHTYGSQLLQVHTSRGELVFGSDTYSSWEGIRDWNVANIQQTDTVQQMLAYEKCYVLTGNNNNNCLAAHERLSYSTDYPITSNWWTIPDGNCSRAAELTLANGEPTHVPSNVADWDDPHHDPDLAASLAHIGSMRQRVRTLSLPCHPTASIRSHQNLKSSIRPLEPVSATGSSRPIAGVEHAHDHSSVSGFHGVRARHAPCHGPRSCGGSQHHRHSTAIYARRSPHRQHVGSWPHSDDHCRRRSARLLCFCYSAPARPDIGNGRRPDVDRAGHVESRWVPRASASIRRSGRAGASLVPAHSHSHGNIVHRHGGFRSEHHGTMNRRR